MNEGESPMKDKGPMTKNNGNIPMQVLEEIKEEEKTRKVRHHQRRTRRRNEMVITLRAELGELGKDLNDSIIFKPAATKYFVDGTFGSSQEKMMAAIFAFDTGAGLNIILKSSLPRSWES